MTTSTTTSAKPLGPILVAHLLSKVDALLVDLLRTLSPTDWTRQTIAPKWKVKDVVGHLLDTQLRKLSMVRDGHAGEPASISSDADLVAFIDRLNEEGVHYFRRLSPAVLISMLEMSSRESARFHESLDPFAPAQFAVSWAGEESSLNWFDTARELTERWHHQQQIRLATDRPGIMTPELYHPVLDCFMRGLPHAYRHLAAPEGAQVQVDIAGACGGTWYLVSKRDSWELLDGPVTSSASRITIPQEIAWRIFTKGIDREAARAAVHIDGEEDLAIPVLHLRAIVG